MTETHTVDNDAPWYDRPNPVGPYYCGPRPHPAHPDCPRVTPLTESDAPKGDAIQQSEGGKWHRVWWPERLEDASNRFVTHVGMYRPDRDQRRPAAEVPEADRCRRCFPTRVIPPEPSDQ